MLLFRLCHGVLSLKIASFKMLICFRNVANTWIGFSDQKNEGKWKWTNPAATCNKFTKWRRGEPNNSGNKEDCGAIVKSWNGQWNDAGCNAKYSFVCEIGAAASDLCPIQSFKFKFQGLRYEFVTTQKTWNGAETHCKGLNGHLVTVTSQRMDDELLAKMRQK